MACQDEWNVRCPWFWLSILFAVFGFSGPGTQMLTNLYPWELCFGSSYFVLIHPPLVCAYCLEHIFLAGDWNVFLSVASCALAWGCACRKARGFGVFLLPFFFKCTLQIAGYRHSPLNTLWKSALLQCVKLCYIWFQIAFVVSVPNLVFPNGKIQSVTHQLLTCPGKKILFQLLPIAVALLPLLLLQRWWAMAAAAQGCW